MKSTSLYGTVFALICSIFGHSIMADTIPPTGRVVDVASQNLFVPIGFDDNDETLVVLDGYLADTCYKITPAVVTKDLEHHQIIVEQQAREFPGICFDMTVPFTTVVKVGVLPEGEFTVITNHGQMTQRLPVKRAPTTSPDDYLYAPIDSAQVDQNSDGTFFAMLNGRFTTTCASIDRVIITNHEKTIEVMPVMSIKNQADRSCAPLVFPFHKEITLPEVEPGAHLLHVRSLDGQSVNVVFRVMPPTQQD